MLLTLLMNNLMTPVTPPVTEDFGDGWLPNDAKSDIEKRKAEKIKKTNEEVFIIVNSVMVCLN